MRRHRQPDRCRSRNSINNMTDQTDVTYVAQIILTLPGQPDKATAIVTLAPADKIPLGEKAKPLSETTLAELSAYGEALEAEVWDTFEAITLHDLSEEAQVEIVVLALDAKGQVLDAVEDWLTQAILLPDPSSGQPKPASPGPAAISIPEPEQPEEQPETAVLEEKQVIQPERAEADTTAEFANVEAHPPAQPTPEPSTTIIPSQARVRVAGARLPLAESGGAAVDILLDEAPLRAMQAHALSSLDREVAGVMVGRQPEKQPDGRYVVHIIDSIVAKHTVMQGASVTYTPESWRYMTDTLWEKYPDESAVIVGWYHTHPGFGIFLSGMDLFIHQNFFTQIWHVAYVLDPRARTSGFFCWNRQRTKVNRYDFRWPAWAVDSW